MPPRLRRADAVFSSGRSRFRREALAEKGRKRFNQIWRRGPVDVVATIFHAWKSGRETPGARDLLAPVFSAPQVRLVIFLLDISDSMAAARRLARQWVSRSLNEAYFRRDPVAVVTAQGTSARLMVQPTTSLHFVLHRLAELEEGGATPLKQGIRMAERLIRQWRERYPVIDLYVISDGRSTEPLTGRELERSLSILRRFVRHIYVVNPVNQATPFARSLAALLGGTCLDPGEFLKVKDNGLEKGSPSAKLKPPFRG